MKLVCVVIMGSLKTRIDKSYSYSISFSWSNLKQYYFSFENEPHRRAFSKFVTLSSIAVITVEPAVKYSFVSKGM